MKSVLLAFLAVIVSFPAFAEGLSIVVVDTNVLMTQSKASEDVTKQLQKKRDSVVKTLAKEEKKLLKEEKKLIVLQKEVSVEEFAPKAKEFEKKRIAFQKQAAMERKKINAAAVGAEKQLMAKIVEVVGKLSVEKKYDLVLTKQNVVIGSNALDITKDAMERLNKEQSKLKVEFKDKK